MRWAITEQDDIICQACLGRSRRPQDGFADDGSLFELVDPDERQAEWLVRLFLDESPVICGRCTQGLEADEWLERRIEGHGDERAERRGAIQCVHEIISKYKRDSCMGDADEHDPGYLGSPEDYEPHEPFFKVEWAFLDLIPIWLNLEMLRLNPGRTLGDSEQPGGENLHLRQQNELMAD